MGLDWANVGEQEVWWTVPALVAFTLTLGMIAWAWRSFAAIRWAVRAHPDRYHAWGPRWNFALLLIGAMIGFALGWLGYVAVGLIAMATPPPISEANREAAEWVGWLLVAMEAAHACAQFLLFAALRSLAGQPYLPFWRLSTARRGRVYE